MKKKLVIFVIVSLLMIPLSIVTSYIIDSILINQKIDTIDINNIAVNTINNPNLIKIVISLQALGMMLFFMLIFVLKENVFKSDIRKITKNIMTPVSNGQGQYGTSQFATNKEFQELYLKIKLSRTNYCLENGISKGGIVVSFLKKHKHEEISIIADNKHCLCLGNTGAGKTRRILIESLCMLGLAGEGIIVSDPKR